MKFIFGTLFLFFLTPASAQMSRVVDKDIANLPGKWKGSIVVTTKMKQITYLSKLEIVDRKDSLMLTYLNTPKLRKITDTIQYFMRVYDTGLKLSFNNHQFEVVSVRRRGPRTTVVAERSGVDNYRSADFQVILTMGPTNLNIVEGVRYDDMVDFAIRRRAVFEKN